jgi:DNA polymerase III subunit beta
LSNVLLQVTSDQLAITGTDLEVEMIARVVVVASEVGEITVPARKLLDICRELPDKADIDFSVVDQRLVIKSGRFRSALSTLPANDFPMVDKSAPEMTTIVNARKMKRLLDRTAFAMAQQDVRFFLNGMLVELSGTQVRTVATDGHRLAMSNMAVEGAGEGRKQVIVPRKGVLELQRMLHELEGDVEIAVGANHLCAETKDFTLTTKLVDGRFPDYERVVPRNGDKVVLADKLELRQALSRTSILSNEKFRGIRINLTAGQLQLTANNPEQEEAEETVSVDYAGSDLEVGFNASYIQDVLAVVEGDKIRITLHDSSSSALLEEPEEGDSVFVVMPMKL